MNIKTINAINEASTPDYSNMIEVKQSKRNQDPKIASHEKPAIKE